MRLRLCVRPRTLTPPVKGRFVSQYGRVSPSTRALALQAEFSRVLEKRAQYFSFDPASDKITAVRQEVDKTKQVMVDNIDKVLQRGERIELLVQYVARALVWFDHLVCC